MPLFSDTATSGNDFDGTSGNGELDFAIGPTDAERALIQNIGLSSTVDIDTFFFRLAPSDAQLLVGEYIELGFNGSPSKGGSIFGCEIMVPPLWRLYIVTTGAGAADKYLNVDWRRITYTTTK